jgi:hypothetical protein
MRNTMPTGASVTFPGIRGHDAGICDLTPRSRWPESLVTIPESAVTMKRNMQQQLLTSDHLTFMAELL